MSRLWALHPLRGFQIVLRRRPRLWIGAVEWPKG
jgi:hypothetical protein